jgi:hypothetical protein
VKRTGLSSFDDTRRWKVVPQQSHGPVLSSKASSIGFTSLMKRNKREEKNYKESCITLGEMTDYLQDKKAR